MVVAESLAVPALKAAAASAAGLGTILPAGAVGLMRRVSASVGIAPPTPEMLAEEDPRSRCALFRHLPELTDRLAWRSLGAADKTPIHTCRVDSPSGFSAELLVKRDDLLSPLYGGNKVRTLQHQLATCEARRERGERRFRQLVSYGTGGSNQVIATVVHSRSLGWDGEDGAMVHACWGDKDEPDLDNTLNMLSVLSFPNVGWHHNWGASVGPRRFFGAFRGAWTQRDFVPMMAGGNCPAGVLGQVGGILELAEQIASGECADPRQIYLPVGSACTVSGLAIGTVLARRLGLPALSRPDFQIVGCNVHEVLALLDEKVGFHTNPALGFIPLTISHTVRSACAALRDIGGPDLEEETMDFVKSNVSMRSAKDVVGIYGTHSDKTRSVARAYDSTGSIVDSDGKEAKPLWMCGHFVAKAFTPLLQDLEEDSKDGKTDVDGPIMLWMTKSAVQPRGNVDEWSAMLKENETIRCWADKGKAESILRPGRVSTSDGSAEDYRSIMTKLL